MSSKTAGIVLIIVGIIIIVISLTADTIGIGRYPSAIGPLQWINAGVGLVIAFVGAALALRKSSKP